MKPTGRTRHRVAEIGWKKRKVLVLQAEVYSKVQWLNGTSVEVSEILQWVDVPPEWMMVNESKNNIVKSGTN